VKKRARLTAAEWANNLADAGVAADFSHRLGVYLELLADFDRVMNLTGSAENEGALVELVMESLAAAPWLAGRPRVLDVGSGNGIPIVPLLVCVPDLEATLLEPRERRWAFLREVVRSLDLRGEVRRERLDRHRERGYDAVTVRGVPGRLWRREMERVLGKHGVVLWWCGPGAAAREFPAGSGVVVSELPDRRRGNLVAWDPRST
jgi:16S rRNA (guanine(527)-N(7))-methyltransferase RsmG